MAQDDLSHRGADGSGAMEAKVIPGPACPALYRHDQHVQHQIAVEDTDTLAEFEPAVGANPKNTSNVKILRLIDGKETIAKGASIDVAEFHGLAAMKDPI